MRTVSMSTVMTAAAAALMTALVLVPTSAQADARVTVSNDFGKAEADTKYATTIQLNGSGFQSIQGGHGGIYVFFGTVSGTWQPSKGGQTGTNLLYVPDSEAKDNQGFQKFVTFPGNKQTGDAANGGQLKDDGSWSTSIVVPGAKFSTVDRNGKAQTVDCLKSACGIITVGAHGVKNANNETFTPVSFADLKGAGEPAAQEAEASTAPATDSVTKVDPSKAIAAVDRGTAVVGRVLSFTGGGFLPGEQVIATLDDGRAAVGPLSAGPSGEIAGVLQLPEGTQPGTHVLRITGAASGAKPTVSFPIAADNSAATATATADDEGGLAGWVPFAFLALAVIALLSAATFARLRFRSIRRQNKVTSPAAPTKGEVTHAP